MARRRTKTNPSVVVVIVVMATIAGFILWQRSQRWPMATGPSVRVATWNLKKFSERARPDLVTIAKIIQQENFDLVAIQEVQQQGQAVQRLRRQLGEPWRHVVSDPAGDGERFAFIYKANVMEPVDEPRLLDAPGAEVFARRPWIGAFKAGQFDFALVTVHLSWGDVDRRRSEAQALAQIVQQMARTGPERDIIVLGDFNEQKGKENLTCFASAGWIALNTRPTNLSSREVYDNLLINRDHTREWSGRVGVVPFDETMFDNDDPRAGDDVSDHRPVWADFATTGADDD